MAAQAHDSINPVPYPDLIIFLQTLHTADFPGSVIRYFARREVETEVFTSIAQHSLLISISYFSKKYLSILILSINQLQNLSNTPTKQINDKKLEEV